MPENITPEEKLLKIIENPNSAKAVKLKPKKIKINFLSFLSPAKFAGAFKQILKDKNKVKSFFLNLKFINQALIVIAGILTVYLIFDFIKGRPNLDKITAYTSERIAAAAAPVKAEAEIKLAGISDYLAQIAKRDIFHFIPLRREEKLPEAKQVLEDLLKNLKLVGIIWSKNPQAMIEDKSGNRTLLLNEGDMIDKMKVKQILRDKVIISYEDQEMELL